MFTLIQANLYQQTLLPLQKSVKHPLTSCKRTNKLNPIASRDYLSFYRKSFELKLRLLLNFTRRLVVEMPSTGQTRGAKRFARAV